MKIITTWTFGRGRGRKQMKRLLLKVTGTLAAVGVLLAAWQVLPDDFLTRLSTVSSVLAVPEGAVQAWHAWGEPAKTASEASETPQEKPSDASAPQTEASKLPTESRETTQSRPQTEPPSMQVEEKNRGMVIEEQFSSTLKKNCVVYGLGSIRNDTKKTEEAVAKLLQKKWGQTLVDDEKTVQVLIMHTHTTESYEPYERSYYDVTYAARTTDENYNMVAVGNRIAEQLTAAGIGVAHDTTVHDYPSYSGSYDRSAVTVKKWLEKYPTITVVLDIHRDAIERKVSGKTVRVKPVTEIAGKKAAQLMIIAGCDDGTMNMPHWEENLRFGAALQNQLETDWPTLTRPLMFCYRKYNQDLTTGSLLIEVGGHANTLDEALYTGELIGKSLSALLKSYIKK